MPSFFCHETLPNLWWKRMYFIGHIYITLANQQSPIYWLVLHLHPLKCVEMAVVTLFIHTGGSSNKQPPFVWRVYEARHQQRESCINPFMHFIHPTNRSVSQWHIRTKVFFSPPTGACSRRHKDPLCILGHVPTVSTAVIYAREQGRHFSSFN